MKFFFILFVSTCMFSSCAFKLRERSGKALLVSGTHSIAIPRAGSHTLRVVYTGCGGLVIANEQDEAFMVDPYYTGHNPARVFVGGIIPDSNNRNKVMASLKEHHIDPKKIENVLVSHAHYDHLEDLPYLLAENLLAKPVKIIASSTAGSAIGKRFKDTFINADDYMYRQAPNNNGTGKWMDISAHMRVLPIEASHAPHFYFGIHLMRCKKKTCRGSRPANCSDTLSNAGTNKRTRALRWKEGTTYAYLVDILDENKNITLRLFLQNSSCDPPFAFPPAEELGKKPVDVAFLCAASSNHLHNYPKAILSLLKASQTVLIHWEDFFKDMYKPNPKRVRGTSFTLLMKNLRSYYGVSRNSDLKYNFCMPEPLSLINIRY